MKRLDILKGFKFSTLRKKKFDEKNPRKEKKWRSTSNQVISLVVLIKLANTESNIFQKIIN